MSGLQDLGHGIKRIDDVIQETSPTSSANHDVFKLMTLTKAYHKYKRDYVKQLFFTPEEENLSKFKNLSSIVMSKYLVSATLVLEHAPLEAVYNYFDTATYDEIERDEKVTL